MQKFHYPPVAAALPTATAPAHAPAPAAGPFFTPATPPPVSPAPPTLTPEKRPFFLLRYPRLLALATAAAAVAGLVMLSTEPLFVVAFIFVLVVPFEKLFPRHPGKRIRRPQVGTDIAHALLTPLLGPVTIAFAVIIGFASLAWIPGLLLRPLVGMIPAVALPFVGIALFDLTIYWVHRWNHEVPFLWRFHAIHHSTEDLDWVSGFRNHPLEAAIIAPPFVLLIAAGFTAEFTGVLAVIQIVTGLFLHANVRWRWRPLHRIVITPEFHHWHHTNDPQAINTNYSVFLPLWDIIFGTYFMPKDRRPEKYGVNEFIPKGVIPQLLHPLRGMGNPFRVFVHPIRSLKSGWRFTKVILADVWKSTRRPTHRAPEPFVAAHSAPSAGSVDMGPGGQGQYGRTDPVGAAPGVNRF